jgi:hypothetical protein
MTGTANVGPHNIWGTTYIHECIKKTEVKVGKKE